MLTEHPLWVTVHWNMAQPETDHLPAMFEQEVELVLDEQWMDNAAIEATRRAAGARITEF
jgi:hypothetical protein